VSLILIFSQFVFPFLYLLSRHPKRSLPRWRWARW
jgi:hypothetical protein